MVHVDGPRHDLPGFEGGGDKKQGPITWARVRRFGPSTALGVLLLAFVLANTQSVAVNFLFFKANAPLIVVLVATALVGALMTLLMQRRRKD